MPKSPKIQAAVNERDKLYAEGHRLYAKGHRLSRKLYAKRAKLFADGRKLYAEGDILLIDAAIAEIGEHAVVQFLPEIEIDGVVYRPEGTDV